ncbi:MAG TPA: EamA family transporter [Limnochordales bacterium]
MTAAALLLVLAAAFFHAGWNFLAKRSAGGAAFVWLATAVASVLWAPAALAVWWWRRPVLGWAQAVAMAGSAALHLGYYLLLQRGYQVGGLSQVYPIARGTGPLLATLLAVVLFGERPSALAVAGAALVAAGIAGIGGIGLAGRGRGAGADGRAVRLGLLTGLFIALYTVWDGQSVGRLGIPPLLHDWATSVGRAVYMLPYALRHRGRVAAEWAAHRLEVVGVAVLSPLAYILVLTALSFTPVSYVAPAREMSVLVGTVLGTRVLAEPYPTRRLLAAAVIVLGVVALAVG